MSLILRERLATFCLLAISFTLYVPFHSTNYDSNGIAEARAVEAGGNSSLFSSQSPFVPRNRICTLQVVATCCARYQGYYLFANLYGSLWCCRSMSRVQGAFRAQWICGDCFCSCPLVWHLLSVLVFFHRRLLYCSHRNSVSRSSFFFDKD